MFDMDFVLLLIKDYQRYKEEHCVVITIYTFDIEVTLCYMFNGKCVFLR